MKTEVLKRVYNMIGDGAGLLCAQDFLQTTLLFLGVETVCVDQGQILYHYNFGNGMSGHAPGNVSWEQFLRRTTAIDAYRRLCRVLATMDNLDSVQRKRIEDKFLRSISGTALPEVWKLPADLIPAGMGVIARKWGTWALPTRDPGQPGDAGQPGGWIHRLSGKLKKLPRRLARFLKSAFGPCRRH